MKHWQTEISRFNPIDFIFAGMKLAIFAYKTVRSH